MKLILGNLTQLKAQLLNESLRSDTQWDAQLAALGQGVAEQMEQACNRKFARVVGDLYEFPANREHVIAPRYPVEAITALELKSTYDGAWTAQTLSAAIESADLAGGIVVFGVPPGVYGERARLTYTGGFWVPNDDAETPEDDDDLPEGATLVPRGLFLAWVLQCKHVWGLSDPLGISAGQDKAGVSPDMMGLSRVDLIPQVKTALEGYKRYSLQ